jgi:queuine tRNA-ribosyltransferase
LKDRLFQNEWIRWELLEGDFRKEMHKAKAPDVIAYDLFSFKTNTPFWMEDFFQEFHDVLLKLPGNKNAIWSSYTHSTANRAAMLAAGFWLGKGVPTHPVSETTIAWVKDPGKESKGRLLGQEFVGRLSRSGAVIEPSTREKALKHPQFSL